MHNYVFTCSKFAEKCETIFVFQFGSKGVELKWKTRIETQ